MHKVAQEVVKSSRYDANTGAHEETEKKLRRLEKKQREQDELILELKEKRRGDGRDKISRNEKKGYS